jgi:hypothetical protein
MVDSERTEALLQPSQRLVRICREPKVHFGLTTLGRKPFCCTSQKCQAAAGLPLDTWKPARRSGMQKSDSMICDTGRPYLRKRTFIEIIRGMQDSRASIRFPIQDYRRATKDRSLRDISLIPARTCPAEPFVTIWQPGLALYHAEPLGFLPPQRRPQQQPATRPLSRKFSAWRWTTCHFLLFGIKQAAIPA